MKTIQIQGLTGHSSILVGESLSRLSHYLPKGRTTVIITDTNVLKLYGNQFPDAPVITIGTGEKIKSLDTIRRIYKELVTLQADRSTVIVGIGGGIVCDITGFAASTFMRGLRFGFVSTTLLSQVDASVGGKNGVNFGGYKNMVGVFNQPEFVICDLEMLKTLPEREFRSGLGEVVKHAAIADEAFFAFLEQHINAILQLEPKTVEKIVHRSVELKAEVVRADEKESGIRRILNFGHTFGHALETLTGATHGEAVAAGMVLAAKASADHGFLKDGDVHRLKNLINRLGLPVRLKAPSEDIMKTLARDKKKIGTDIHFVMLEKIGSARVVPLTIEGLESIPGNG